MLLERLEPAARAAVGELEDGVYGVLWPRPGAALEPRSATNDVALLFLGNDCERTVARLILDGVLEIEHEGAFVSGVRAGELVLAGDAAGGRGRIGHLSRAALQYAQELVDLPAALVARRVYFFGRVPVTPALQRDHEPAIDVGPGWAEQRPDSDRVYWRSWRARRAAPGADGLDAGYKLYVSPRPEALRPAVEAVATALATAPGVKAFKVGADAAALCRPDKLVVYFDRIDDLRAAAERVRERLDGCPAHGVPFTAAITLDGLLSWGADPPTHAASWRMWVAEQLANHLCDARATGDGTVEPWRYALERLRLDGVDTESWVPTSGMWAEALATT
jgi:hypothetical protein